MGPGLDQPLAPQVACCIYPVTETPGRGDVNGGSALDRRLNVGEKSCLVVVITAIPIKLLDLYR